MPSTADGERARSPLVPGPRRAWLVARSVPHGVERSAEALTKFLLPVVTQYLQSALEVEHAANELAERYEEINLLYTISEILGRTVSLDEAAKTILSRSLGDGRRAARVGARRTIARPTRCAPSPRSAWTSPSVPPISRRRPVQRQRAASSARSIRCCVEGDEMLCPRGSELSPRRDALGADHVDRPGAARRGAARRRESVRPPVGPAVHRRRPEAHRRDRDADRHGDSERAARARVGRAAAARARDAARARPADEAAADDAIVAPEANVAARVVPAESVGGDFYNLFRLGSRARRA